MSLFGGGPRVAAARLATLDRYASGVAAHPHTGLRAQLRKERNPRWVRAQLDGETVADSRRTLLVWEPGRVLPQYAFPAEDVQAERLPPDSAHEAEGLPGHLVLDWNAFDRWLEEEEEVFAHPRDPYHRVDVLESSRHVRVELDGEPLAESRRPRLLFETGLPTRYYLPREDVRAELLPSEKHTRCPYKGLAGYWSVRVGDRVEDDLVWMYPEPVPECPAIRGLLAFFNERVDLVVDGEPLERPQTQWSQRART